MFKVHGSIWIESENGALLGVGRMKLLEKIDELGSITAAAKSMNMSYRQAWELVKSMNTQAKKAFVQTSAGGLGGGGTTVTIEGKNAVKEYKKLMKNFDHFKNRETEKLKL